MKAAAPMLDALTLRQILRYDGETGTFTWLIEAGGRARKGAIAGTVDSLGYVIIRYRGRGYKAHRLAWLYVHGEWPVGLLDHFDEDKSNNRIGNLRQTDGITNNQNVTPANCNTSSGLRGVSWFGQYGKWKASFMIGGEKIFVGHYDDPQEAYRACEARRAIEHAARSIITNRSRIEETA